MCLSLQPNGRTQKVVLTRVKGTSELTVTLGVLLAQIWLQSDLIWLLGLATEIPPLLKTLVTLAPGLTRLPILGKLIIQLSGVNPMSDTQAIGELQDGIDKRKKTRKRLREDNGKYVIKVSDAMECVENNVDGKLLVNLGKSIVSVLTGENKDLGTQIMDPIYQCLMENRLRQDTPRRAHRETKIGRPARGHGEGRK